MQAISPTISIIWSRLMCAAVGLAITASSAAQAQSIVPEAKAALPESMRRSGKLKVAGAMIWPPFNWMDKGRINGMEIDLITLLARKMGLQAEFTDIKFATLIPSIRNGRYDVAIGQIGINAKREKVVSFVPNFVGSYSLLVQKGRTNIDINNLCGRKLAATVGSAQLKDIILLSHECVEAGRKPISYEVYGDPLNTYLAIANGRGEGYMVSHAPGLYIAKRIPRLEVAPGILRDKVLKSGFVIGKNKPQLGRALSLALQSAGKDGSYLAILRKYGIEEGALEEFRPRASRPRVAAR
ncbi:transporter substrate-binding domain-containing protein [Sphingobium sp. H39-3-25]|uniref:transporter substrate-binding domain-containing protein n=1 Tax=Sphingobium arseniciresistens TaxID=3030834 RepID=UPI0023B8F145|nr:transporter substrate-binding domain-containing protein [Sphingobium arseniciresistens]